MSDNAATRRAELSPLSAYPDEHLFYLDEVGEILRCDQETARRLTERKQLEYVMISKRAKRVSAGALRRYISKKTVSVA